MQITLRSILCITALLTASSVFSAAVLPVKDGLVLQLDASTLTGLSNNDAVSTWNGVNAAGNTVAFTQTADVSQPSYQSSVASLGGAPAVYFDADYMQFGNTLGITGNQGRTIFVVWADAVNTSQNYQHAVHLGKEETNKAYGYSVNRNGQVNVVGNHYWGAGFNGSLQAKAAGNVGMISYNGTTDALITNGWYGGYTTKTDVNTVAGVTLIGSRLNPSNGAGASSTEGLKGSIAEVLIYDRALTTNEQYQVNQYLSQKYSLSTPYYQQSGTDWNTSQVKIDFDSALPAAWGTYVTADCGIIDDGSGSNNILRLINTAGGLNNQAYNNERYSATGSIAGKFDLRFTSAAADGVSFVLAGDSVDVSTKIASPNAETAGYAGSFGIGYEIYNRNIVGIYWDGAKIGTIDVGSNGSGFNLKGGQWFTSEFTIDYRPGGFGADVSVSLYSPVTGGLFGTWKDYILNMTPGNSALLMRGRTGGSTANADFDNIFIKYTDASISEFIWTPSAAGAFTDASKWEGGVAPTAGSFIKIQDGTNVISDETLHIADGKALLISGGTTSTGGNASIYGGSTLGMTGGTLTGNTLRVGANAAASEYAAGRGTAALTVETGAVLNLGRWLSVGFSCDGLVTVDGGTINLTKASGTGGIILGDRAGSTSKLNLKSGTINNNGTTAVGAQDGNTAELNITGGTFVSKDAVTVGNGKNVGKISVTGGNFKAGNGVTVKSGSSMTLNSGSLVSSNTDFGMEDAAVLLGAGSNAASNKITVEKGGTFSTNRSLRMGVNSGDYGELVVNGSATVSGQYIFLGNYGNGKVTVDGGTLTAQNVIMGEKPTGNQVGVLEVRNGGIAKFSGYFDAGDKPTANGTVTLSGNGSQLRVGGNFNVGGDEGNNTSVGTLTQTGASFLTTPRLGILDSTSGTSSVSISKDSYVLVSASAYNTAFDDAYRAAHTAGAIYVGTGAEDIGSYLMQDGTVSAPGLITAAGSNVQLNNTGHYNYVTINSGTNAAPATINGLTTIDASLTAPVDDLSVVIGYTSADKTNVLTVGPEGVVTTNKNVRLGRNANSYGELAVQGKFTQSLEYLLIGFMGEGKVTVDGGTLSAKNTIMGDNAGGNCVGTLNVINGGNATLTRLSVADKNVAKASVTVSGSTLTVTGDTLVGNYGSGEMLINGNSAVSLKTLNIGAENGGTGTMTVRGDAVVTTGSVRVGYNGKGTLILDGNAVLTASGEVMNATNSNVGAAGSQLTVKGNATLNINGVHFIIGRGDQVTSSLEENGTINYNGSGVCGLSEFGKNVVFNMTGGTFNVNTLPKSYGGYLLGGNSIQNQSGGLMNIGTDSLAVALKLSGSSTYNLTGGRLNVSGSIDKGNGTLHLKDAGILSANVINYDFTQEGGTLAPGPNWDGNGIAVGTTTINGTYTAKAGSTVNLEMNLENGTADQLHVTGKTVFEEGAKLVLDYDRDLLTSGMSFDLFDFDGNVEGWDKLVATLPEFDLNIWNITATEPGVINFSVNGNAIPEPAAWLLLLGGVFGLAFFRRRH